MIGKIILNYVIDSVLGAGGMGTVYLGHHQQIERKVAIKLLNPAYTHNQNIRERFKHEALLLSQMQHPNIVGLYDYVENEAGVFLIMEYVEGLTLDEYILKKSGPIPEEQAIVLMKQILEGFLYAHARGIIHRDIKPANIIVTNDKKIKILDFGIAKALEQNHSMTKTGTKMGTVMFMSPEQVKGAELDIRSDIYSLGVTLFQMLTGKEPYDEKIHSEFDVTVKIVQEPLPKMKTMYPTVSERMQSIVDKACAKNTEDRFANAAQFLKALTDPFEKISAPLFGKDFKQPAEINQLTQKKSSVPFAVYVLIVFCLVATGVYFIFFHNQYSQKDVQDRVIAFYDKMNNKDPKLYDFYDHSVVEWFGQSNVQKDLLKLKALDNGENIIDESTFAYEKDTEGNHLITFKRTYKPQKGSSITKTTKVKLKPNLKIYWINNVENTRAVIETAPYLLLVKDFFRTTEEQNVQKLLKYYRNPVNKWFTMQDVTHETIKIESKKYWSDKARETSEIVESTFKVAEMESGEKIITFSCDYKIRYVNGKTSQSTSRCRIVLDKDDLIIEIE